LNYNALVFGAALGNEELGLLDQPITDNPLLSKSGLECCQVKITTTPCRRKPRDIRKRMPDLKRLRVRQGDRLGDEDKRRGGRNEAELGGLKRR
jgi:hypothetical protein